MDLLPDLSLIVALLLAVISPLAAAHALLFKRDSRAAIGWVGLCLLLPIAGPVIYLLFGINRIQRRAQQLDRPRLAVEPERGRPRHAPQPIEAELDPAQLRLATIGAQLASHRLCSGNRVEPLENGNHAYPAMLDAIASAQHAVWLSTYIFDTDATGRAFVDALTGAERRGCCVRVLIDGVGQYYSWPTAARLLRRSGVTCARFLAPRLLPPRLSVNLRNHHKMLIIDDQVGFTGGMNIGGRHHVSSPPQRGDVADLQFRLSGPIVARLAAEFRRSWEFSIGETLPTHTPSRAHEDGCSARVITDGPDEDLDRITLTWCALIAEARHSVLIETPYFLPPRELIGALQAASLRGVEVRLVLPEKNNLPFVHWATRNMLWELVYQGVNVHYQPPPFSHAKLLVIDEHYLQIGSSNWDARSLRLNFELQVELFDHTLAGAMAARIRSRADHGRAVTMDELDGRSLAVRLRDSFFWLFSPYL
ncbi:MAG: phospholipase D-like domain-containing protein [Wenzhouxiangellaceae bacterium]|nr:phospholipase D-like domain-containing protein [Wenzhouxiangellaceae bacterium]